MGLVVSTLVPMSYILDVMFVLYPCFIDGHQLSLLKHKSASTIVEYLYFHLFTINYEYIILAKGERIIMRIYLTVSQNNRKETHHVTSLYFEVYTQHLIQILEIILQRFH